MIHLPLLINPLPFMYTIAFQTLRHIQMTEQITDSFCKQITERILLP